MPERALVHRREHLDVGGGIEAVMGGQARRGQLADLGEDRLRAVARDEKEVAHVVGSRDAVGQLTGVDRVRRAHDQRARGLAEDLGQPRRRHHPRSVRGHRQLEQILEHAARPDRRELVDVADEQHVGPRPDRRQ